MNSRILQLLLAGEYVCDVRYPNEFKVLQRAQDRAAVNDWLSKLDMRLARVGEDGAWFMAPAILSDEAIAEIKRDMREFRDRYGPAVRMLDLIRQINGERALCAPGERIQLVHLDSQVSGSTTLAAQLRSLIEVIHGASRRLTDRENLRKLLDHLASDGYVVVLDKMSETYQVTGKIDQLYAVLTFLDENKVIEEQEVNDQLDLEGDAGGRLL